MERPKSIEELLEEVKHALDTFYAGLVAVNKDVQKATESVKTVGKETKEELNKAIQEKLTPALARLEETIKRLNSVISDVRVNCKLGVSEATTELKQETKKLEERLKKIEELVGTMDKKLQNFNTAMVSSLTDFHSALKKGLEKHKREMQEYAEVVSQRIKESEQRVIRDLNVGALILGFALGLVSHWFVSFFFQILQKLR